ncbi:MAG: helix-turn-helix domain-containing protein [Bacteroidales bacterium]|nr:helix-turn-helix domain-containing protein [Bacteroidales bacterium]
MKKLRYILFYVVCLWCGITYATDETVLDLIHLKEDTLSQYPKDKRLLKEIGYLYMEQGDYQNSYAYGEKLYQLGAETGDEEFAKLYGHVLMGAARLSETNDRNMTSFRNLEQALVLAERYNKREALVSIHNSLGIYYLEQNFDIQKSTEHYFKALDYAKALGDRRRYAIILSNLSTTFLMEEDTDCPVYALEAYEEAVENDELVPRFYSAFVLAYYYMRTGDFLKAKKYIHDVEELIGKLGYADTASVDEYYANLYYAQGNLEGAIKMIEKAMTEDSSPGLAVYISRRLFYSDILSEAKQYRRAMDVLNDAQDFAEAHCLDLNKGDIYEKKMRLFEKTGHLDSALAYSQKYNAFTDSVQKRNRALSFEEARIQNGIYIRDKRIDLQRIQLLNYHNRIIIIVGILLLVVSITIIVIVFYYKKSKLYRAIVRQNQESKRREEALLATLRQQPALVPAQGTAAALSEDKADDLITRFTDLMLTQQLYTDPSVNINNVAERLDTNRTYLSKAINNQLGHSFTQVVNSYRVRHAIKLISDTEANLPLKVVSSDSGFSSLSTFYTTFQQETGMTPAKYRAQLE